MDNDAYSYIDSAPEFDKIVEVLPSQGRPAPKLIESHDRVQVTVYRRILKPEAIDFIAKADETPSNSANANASH